MKRHKRTHESVIVTAAVLDGIFDMAMAGAPREVCGLLLGPAEGHVQDWLPLDNAAGDADSFRIDPRAYRSAERGLEGTGHHIVGVFHSHPAGSGCPSAKDQRMARILEGDNGRWLYLICGLKEGRHGGTRLWRLSRGGLKELSVTISQGAHEDSSPPMR